MEKEKIHNLLFARTAAYEETHVEKHTEHYLEQYRTYLHIFNHTSERRQKSNEFFLGINAAIIGILGYIEVRSTFNSPILFFFIPAIGVGICYSWYRVIASYKQLNRAKFKVIHALESRLPAALFETEWEILGRGKDRNLYVPLSNTERTIPIMFISLYILIIFTKLPWGEIITLYN